MNTINLSLWEFSCNLYQRPGVEASCIYLQDQHQIDIPLMLFCCWVAIHYGELTQSQLQLAKSIISPWSSKVIGPIRTIRRDMKISPELQDKHWQDIRLQVKSLELAAERSLLINLEQLLSGQTVCQGSVELVWHNLFTCFPNTGIGEAKDSLALIVDALPLINDNHI